jgi:hypothetical protein
MKTPDEKTIAFTFMSHPVKLLSQRWQARLVFPPGAGPETLLAVELTDGEGAPVQEGVFEFAGQSLPVKDGRAAISYADFIRGKHETALWLHRPGQEPLPGGLTFA